MSWGYAPYDRRLIYDFNVGVKAWKFCDLLERFYADDAPEIREQVASLRKRVTQIH